MVPSRPTWAPLTTQRVLAVWRIQFGLAAFTMLDGRGPTGSAPFFDPKTGQNGFEGGSTLKADGWIPMGLQVHPQCFDAANRTPTPPAASLSRKRMPAFSKADWIRIRVET